MDDFKELIELITKSIDKFFEKIPAIQKKMLKEVLLLSKKLDTKGGNVSINAANLKIIAGIKNKLQKIILNPEYVKSVKEYVKNFDEITKLQNQYFQSVSDKFTPPKLTAEIKKQAKEAVVNKLTETGIEANVTDGIKEILRKGITGGNSYENLNQQLTDYLIENESGEGQLQRYTKQISTDALNQFSRTYSNIVSSDLGLEWFRYSGSNIETTRPFCLAAREHKWFHLSELPEVIKGNFPEFKDFDGVIYAKTGLPQGMYPETDVSNFATLLGGYSCRHQWRPVSEDLVPADKKNKIFATAEYKKWKAKNN